MTPRDCDCADCRPPAYVPKPYSREYDESSSEIENRWRELRDQDPGESA